MGFGLFKEVVFCWFVLIELIVFWILLVGDFRMVIIINKKINKKVSEMV